MLQVHKLVGFQIDPKLNEPLIELRTLIQTSFALHLFGENNMRNGANSSHTSKIKGEKMQGELYPLAFYRLHLFSQAPR
jgi:hypothetical protein